MEPRASPALLRSVLAALVSLIPGALASNDCNGNGVEDGVETRNGSVPDCNLNGRPDPCELLSVPGMLSRGAETPVNTVWPSSLHVIDFDADGRLDALLGDRNGISVLRGGRDGFLPARAYRPPGWPAFGFSVGDWSGDGLLDLAGIVTLGSGLRIWRNTGDDFEPVPPPEQTPEWQMGVLLEDMDLDGRTDLIEAGEFAVRFHWNDDGAFTGSFTDLHHVTWGLSLRALDANGDGAPDLGLDFAGRQFGTSLNEGGRSFSDIVIRGFPVETRDCAPGDLDADGTIDLLTVEIDGRVAARRLLDMSELREGFLARARVTSLLAADLDGDGA